MIVIDMNIIAAGAAAIALCGGVIPAAADPIDQWGSFEVAVRDGLMAKDSARAAFAPLHDSLLVFCRGAGGSYDTSWLFPVRGGGLSDVGAGGYKPGAGHGSSTVKGYDFYDGNRHGGHPAYDIFMKDRNRDCRDDRTGKPVDILAPVDMMVVSVNRGWQAGSDIRGGNYLWAYNPLLDRYFYFAHLDSIKVMPRDRCRAGTLLGTMGRSGKNASPARSPTHLHFMVLRTEGASLRPVDSWSRLQKARRR